MFVKFSEFALQPCLLYQTLHDALAGWRTANVAEANK